MTSNEGIAIQSTLDRLKESFHKSPVEVNVGAVTYLDYKTEFVPDDEYFDPFMYKRKSYEYENELRALVFKAPGDERTPSVKINRMGHMCL